MQLIGGHAAASIESAPEAGELVDGLLARGHKQPGRGTTEKSGLLASVTASPAKPDIDDSDS